GSGIVTGVLPAHQAGCALSICTAKTMIPIAQWKFATLPFTEINGSPIIRGTNDVCGCRVPLVWVFTCFKLKLFFKCDRTLRLSEKELGGSVQSVKRRCGEFTDGP
ncbi:hypothetical protein, partial [Phyllobacterium sp. P5_D12]